MNNKDPIDNIKAIH